MSSATITAFPSASSLWLRQRVWRTTGCLALGDLLATFVAGAATFMFFPDTLRLVEHAVPVISVLFAFAAFGLYPVVGISPAQEFRRILLGSGIAYGIISGTLLLEGVEGTALVGSVLFAWILTFSLVLLSRAALRTVCGKRPWWGISTVIFGSGQNARALFRLLRGNSSIGLKVAGVFDDAPNPWPEMADGRVPSGSTHEGLAFAEVAGIDHAIIALPNSGRKDLHSLLRYQTHSFKHLLVVPDLSNIGSLWVEPRDMGGLLALHVSEELRQSVPQFVKRAIDLVIAGTGALCALPLFAALCLAVRLSSAGPVFYSQSRVGKNSKSVKVWKFRTMHRDADDILQRHLEKNPELRAEWERDRKLKRDPRVTWVGRVMRKTSVDELPQLWNVLLGDMSLVGPRPIVSAEIDRYGEHFQAYAAVRPGITGMWQISGRNNTSYEERVQLDEYYVRNWSVWLDLYIISRTIKTVLAGDGAY